MYRVRVVTESWIRAVHISLLVKDIKLRNSNFFPFKGCPHGRTQGNFASYFCTCTTFSASYTYKITCACTSTTSSDSVGFFVRRTRVRRTNVRACFIQMHGLIIIAGVSNQIVFLKIYTINCFIY